ncbi:hypothetical protein [Hydrogenovibrio sp. SC-1]|uniref:hypothetical protein n=1 Tax=Hydrogenovibrio sp. SC-1 TaxID=2065820 RepID=UPI00130462F2|nr:hypothetical protein [Hydrogenovibrio sp. SC-1]
MEQPSVTHDGSRMAENQSVVLVADSRSLANFGHLFESCLASRSGQILAPLE